MNRRILKHSFSLLNVDYVQLSAKWNYKNVISPYYRLYLIDKGEGYVFNEKETWLLQPGYMYLIPSFTLCSLRCPDFLSQYFIHLFEDSINRISLFHNNRTILKIKATDQNIDNYKRLLEINPFRKINRSDNPKIYEKSIYYKEYEELNNTQDESTFLETQGILLQLISKFLSSKEFCHKDISAIPSKIVDLIDFIHLNLKKNLTVVNLAKKVNQHPDYFSRIFLKLTGERPLSYIHGKRIERAQYIITTSDMTLGQVAEETGFKNIPYFTKIFKRITGLTPGQYILQSHSMNMF